MAFPQQFYNMSYYNSRQIRELFINDFLSQGYDDTANLLRCLRPDATDDPLEFVKTMPDELLPKIIPDTFAGGLGEALLTEMTIRQLEIIGQKGGFFLKEAMKRAAKHAAQKGVPISRVKEYLDSSPAWQTR